jgi:two-component system, chemotaxis family, sensor kinase CheA
VSERGPQMRALFRATALEQLGQLAQVIDELRRGAADPEAEGPIAPTLHLMKGDAALVGMVEIAAALHAAETRAAEAAWDALAAAVASIARDLERGDGELVPDAPDLVEPAVLRGWVRLQTDAIDELSDRLLELSTAYNRLAAGLVRAVRDVPTEALRELAEDADAARRQLDEVIGAAWSLRLASVEDLLQRVAEHARELAGAQGKSLEVRITGSRAELERPMLEALEEPLLHLVRNAIAHGIEEPGARGDKPAAGTLVFETKLTRGIVEIAVEDDGRGMDPAVVRAAAIEGGVLHGNEAGLSEQAALELLFEIGTETRLWARARAGRGLDVVRARIEGLGGVVALSSQPGRGTRCVIAVPAEIARERAIVVECAGGMFALPARMVRAQLRIGEHARRRVAGGTAIRIDQAWAPLCGLDEALGLGAGTAAHDDTPALVLEGNRRRRAFAVDRIDGEHELLRRPADARIGLRELVTASSITDDGRTVLWPSVPALLAGRRAYPRRAAAPPARRDPRPRRVLVADDSPIVVEIVKSILRGANLVPTSVPDGEAAWRALEEELPDLLLTDIDMPRLDGLELLRRVRERWPRLPVVLLTTRDAEADRRRALELGASEYLSKAELDERRLVELVRGLIDAAG